MSWPLEHELPPASEVGMGFSGLSYKWLTLLVTVAGYSAFGGPEPPDHVKKWAFRVIRKTTFLHVRKKRRKVWLFLHWAEPWLPPSVPWWPR